MKLIFILLLTFTISSWAEVNLVTGQYFKHEKIKVAQGLEVSITYNSNDQYIGAWGKSICSELDQRYSPKDRSIYYCNKKINVKLNSKNDFINYKMGLREYQFLKSGELTSICYKSKCWQFSQSKKAIKISRKKNISTLVKNNSNLITEVKFRKRKWSEFKYNKTMLGKLIRYFPQKIQSWTYKDGLLVKIGGDKGKYVMISYEANLATLIENQDKCKEQISYKKMDSRNLFVKTKNTCSKKEYAYQITYGKKNNVKKLINYRKNEKLNFSQNEKLLSRKINNDVELRYNKRRKITNVKTGDGSEANLSYNSKNLIKKVKYSLGTSKINSVSFRYNQNKKISSLENDSGFKVDFLYKKNIPVEIKSNTGDRLKYYYKNKNLKLVKLYKGKKQYSFKLKDNKSKKSAIAVADFYKNIYDSIGFFVDYVPEAKVMF